MVRPRVFVSSTYYDLKHIRSSLENFIESMGFDGILSEKGNIAFSPDIPLDESCYREVENADIFIIIIGGRYGSERSGSEQQGSIEQFYSKYESITKTEYLTASKKNIPTYILVEKSVYADYETFLKNKDNNYIDYAHVDSANIFYLIEEIITQPKNNPIYQFDCYNDIETWLKEQWAGVFRELINQRSNEIQITTLANQINQLEEINKTFKRYLEVIISKVSPEGSVELISDESERLKIAEQLGKIKKSQIYKILKKSFNIHAEELREAIVLNNSIEDLRNHLQSDIDKKGSDFHRKLTWDSNSALIEFNNFRGYFDLDPYVIEKETDFILESQ